MKAIQVENLKKVYNPDSAFPKIALKDVSLEVEESEKDDIEYRFLVKDIVDKYIK